jgi:hypothetical protein
VHCWRDDRAGHCGDCRSLSVGWATWIGRGLRLILRILHWLTAPGRGCSPLEHRGSGLPKSDREADRGGRRPKAHLHEIGQKGATFKSLADAWADTTTPHGKLMITILSGLAEFERELIKARTGEGRQRAKDQGTKFGRKLKLSDYQRAEALQRRASGEPIADIAKS